MCRKPQIRRTPRRQQQLLHRPGLPSFGVAPHLPRRKSIERHIVCGMHRHQLPLQMRRKFGNLQPARRYCAANFVTVALALSRPLQIKQPRIPAGYLHSFVAKLRRPRANAPQPIERCRIPRKLRQKYPRPFNRPHRSLNSTLPLRRIPRTSATASPRDATLLIFHPKGNLRARGPYDKW